MKLKKFWSVGGWGACRVRPPKSATVFYISHESSLHQIDTFVVCNIDHICFWKINTLDELVQCSAKSAISLIKIANLVSFKQWWEYNQWIKTTRSQDGFVMFHFQLINHKLKSTHVWICMDAGFLTSLESTTCYRSVVCCNISAGKVLTSHCSFGLPEINEEVYGPIIHKDAFTETFGTIILSILNNLLIEFWTDQQSLFINCREAFLH